MNYEKIKLSSTKTNNKRNINVLFEDTSCFGTSSFSTRYGNSTCFNFKDYTFSLQCKLENNEEHQLFNAIEYQDNIMLYNTTYLKKNRPLLLITPRHQKDDLNVYFINHDLYTIKKKNYTYRESTESKFSINSTEDIIKVTLPKTKLITIEQMNNTLLRVIQYKKDNLDVTNCDTNDKLFNNIDISIKSLEFLLTLKLEELMLFQNLINIESIKHGKYTFGLETENGWYDYLSDTTIPFENGIIFRNIYKTLQENISYLILQKDGLYQQNIQINENLTNDSIKLETKQIFENSNKDNLFLFDEITNLYFKVPTNVNEKTSLTHYLQYSKQPIQNIKNIIFDYELTPSFQIHKVLNKKFKIKYNTTLIDTIDIINLLNTKLIKFTLKNNNKTKFVIDSDKNLNNFDLNEFTNFSCDEQYKFLENGIGLSIPNQDITNNFKSNVENKFLIKKNEENTKEYEYSIFEDVNKIKKQPLIFKFKQPIQKIEKYGKYFVISLKNNKMIIQKIEFDQNNNFDSNVYSHRIELPLVSIEKFYQDGCLYDDITQKNNHVRDILKIKNDILQKESFIVLDTIDTKFLHQFYDNINNLKFETNQTMTIHHDYGRQLTSSSFIKNSIFDKNNNLTQIELKNKHTNQSFKVLSSDTNALTFTKDVNLIFQTKINDIDITYLTIDETRNFNLFNDEDEKIINNFNYDEKENNNIIVISNKEKHFILRNFGRFPSTKIKNIILKEVSNNLKISNIYIVFDKEIIKFDNTNTISTNIHTPAKKDMKKYDFKLKLVQEEIEMINDVEFSIKINENQHKRFLEEQTKKFDKNLGTLKKQFSNSLNEPDFYF